MILYHGTNIDFNEIDIEKSNSYKDFGKSFYLTDIKEQAERMAIKKSRIFGGEPIVQQYEFEISEDIKKELNILIFDKPNKIWADLFRPFTFIGFCDIIYM